MIRKLLVKSLVLIVCVFTNFSSHACSCAPDFSKYVSWIEGMDSSYQFIFLNRVTLIAGEQDSLINSDTSNTYLFRSAANPLVMWNGQLEKGTPIGKKLSEETGNFISYSGCDKSLLLNSYHILFLNDDLSVEKCRMHIYVPNEDVKSLKNASYEELKEYLLRYYRKKYKRFKKYQRKKGRRRLFYRR